MNWDYIAESAEALGGIGEALLSGRTQKALDEQLQLTRLLEALAPLGILSYPVCVIHTHHVTPDFQMLVGKRRVSVEASKIAVPNYEHAASLQRQGLDAVLMRSEFLRPGQPVWPKEKVIQKAFVIPQTVYPPSLQEVDKVWLEQFQRAVERKLSKLAEDNFQHGEEDWLVLWDRLGTQDWQMQARLTPECSWLAPIWRRGNSFSRIFILGEHFTWTASLTANHSEILPRLPSA